MRDSKLPTTADALVNLEGKVALISGAARGQGATQAELFARCGASVLICDVLDAEGTALAERLQNEGLQVRFQHLDVTDEGGWDRAIAAMRGWVGRIDVLVNNAGIINRQKIVDLDPAAWRKVLEVNLTGTFLGVKKCTPLMAEGGGGSVINISSNSAFSGHYDPAYTASKWGVRGLTKTAAMEFADIGIRVNAVCPGVIVTDLNRSSPHLQPMIDITPLQRSGGVEEVAQLVLFLASDASRFITGEDFVIDGGFTAGAAYRHLARQAGIL